MTTCLALLEFTGLLAQGEEGGCGISPQVLAMLAFAILTGLGSLGKKKAEEGESPDAVTSEKAKPDDKPLTKPPSRSPREPSVPTPGIHIPSAERPAKKPATPIIPAPGLPQQAPMAKPVRKRKREMPSQPLATRPKRRARPADPARRQDLSIEHLGTGIRERKLVEHVTSEPRTQPQPQARETTTRAVTDTSSIAANTLRELTPQNMREALILSEIIKPPLAMRPHDE